jgi:hypothetical protein
VRRCGGERLRCGCSALRSGAPCGAWWRERGRRQEQWACPSGAGVFARACSAATRRQAQARNSVTGGRLDDAGGGGLVEDWVGRSFHRASRRKGPPFRNKAPALVPPSAATQCAVQQRPARVCAAAFCFSPSALRTHTRLPMHTLYADICIRRLQLENNSCCFVTHEASSPHPCSPVHRSRFRCRHDPRRTSAAMVIQIPRHATDFGASPNARWRENYSLRAISYVFSLCSSFSDNGPHSTLLTNDCHPSQHGRD